MVPLAVVFAFFPVVFADCLIDFSTLGAPQKLTNPHKHWTNRRFCGTISV